jgi:hypothetical protein
MHDAIIKTVLILNELNREDAIAITIGAIMALLFGIRAIDAAIRYIIEIIGLYVISIK